MSSPRKSWTRDRSAVSVDLFRVAVGCSLFAHFVRHAIDSTPFRIEFAVLALLSVAVAFGAAPRVTAIALYFLSSTLYRSILPAAVVDDFVANVAALSLALLPLGRTFSPFARSRDDGSQRARVPGAGVLGLMAGVLLLYIIGGMTSLSSESAGVRDALRMLIWAVVAYVVPIRHAVIVGCVIQVAVHTYLAFATDLPLTNAFLASTAIFFWGERQDDRTGKITIDFGAAIQAMALFVVVTWAVASVSGLGTLSTRARVILSDSGLFPLPPTRERDETANDVALGMDARPDEEEISR